MSEDLVRIEIRLLLLRYGKRRVLRALAGLGDQTVEEIEREIREVERTPKAKRPKRSAVDMIVSESLGAPGISELLHALAVAFDNRTFLPQLRDVQRFLDRMGWAAPRLKSRTDAAPLLMRALAKLPPEDLARLLEATKSPGDSDYSLLARAIMDRSRGR